MRDRHAIIHTNPRTFPAIRFARAAFARASGRAIVRRQYETPAKQTSEC